MLLALLPKTAFHRNEFMKHYIRLVFVAVALIAIGRPAAAHHSFVSTYDPTKTIEIDGQVAQFLFRNPHSSLHVIARDKDGEEHRWTIEWSTVSQLGAKGITRDTLRIGDHVIVTGYPGRRADDYRMRIISIKRPIDGWSWDGEFK
jgi:Family of unknown function (DUF6152)